MRDGIAVSIKRHLVGVSNGDEALSVARHLSVHLSVLGLRLLPRAPRKVAVVIIVGLALGIKDRDHIQLHPRYDVKFGGLAQQVHDHDPAIAVQGIQPFHAWAPQNIPRQGFEDEQGRALQRRLFDNVVDAVFEQIIVDEHPTCMRVAQHARVDRATRQRYRRHW